MLSRKKVLLAAIFAWPSVMAGPAWAHARLLTALPAARSVVADTPTEIALTFNEAVKLIVLKVVDKDGKEIPGLGAALTDGATLRIPVAGPWAPGHYTVSYRIAGPDGHAVNGSTTFSITSPKP